MFADRMQRIGPSGTLVTKNLVEKLKAEGVNVISFALGEPDFTTPKHIVEAANSALEEGFTHYTSSYGIPELREAIAEKSRTENKIPCKTENVIVTPTKFGIFSSLLSLAQKGDEVILSDPGFVSYFQIINFTEAKIIGVELSEEDDFRLLSENVSEAITPKTKVIMLNSPNNPTGSVSTKEDLKGIADLAQDNDIYIISDEVYEKIIYDGTHHSIASFDGMFDRTVTLNGFSKSYAMTGWRLGWAIANEDIINAINRIQQHSLTCAVSFAQKAGVRALTGSQEPVKEMVKEFKARRDILVEGINAIPNLRCRVPQGAFYVFVKFVYDMSSVDFSKFLIKKANVAVTPGSAFGICGEGYIRLSYATSRKNITEGLKRIKETLSEL
ncbi:MAG: pyridoxal phosphate-dependent aminotransferase [Thermoplasmata archaeon]|nr:MAG: pyridoxal phosphate-dependent aminotransferase [Thermoplasmata archaeon]